LTGEPLLQAAAAPGASLSAVTRSPVVLALLATALAAATWSPALSNGSTGSVSVRAAGPAVAAASPPAAFTALEQKLEQLPVNTERYTKTSASDEVVRRHGRVRHKHFHTAESGEASLDPAAGEVFSDLAMHTPKEILIGSTAYLYLPQDAARLHGRRWLKVGESGLFGSASAADASFPYHVGPLPSLELASHAPGSYPYLVDLLATAHGHVREAPGAVVDGQQTAHFIAHVQPAKLFRPSLRRQLQRSKQTLKGSVELFLAPSGLPVRVALTVQAGNVTTVETVDVLAFNVPVAIPPPPAGETLDESEVTGGSGGHQPAHGHLASALRRREGV
jgi:hypothetical protein